MAITLWSSRSQAKNRHGSQDESGFSLVELVVAIFILTVGLLAVAASIGYAMMASNRGRGVTNAKLLVVSALEQMETLRDSGQLNFGEISNAAQPAPSTFTGFPTAFLPVSTVPGPDFVYGTADDPGITNPSLAVIGVSRQILVENLSPTLKKITVTLRYSNKAGAVPLVCVSYLNDDSHGNYVP